MIDRRLTEKQAAILGIIARCIEKQGVPPTVRELGDLAGIASPNGVHGHLKALQHKGFLTFQPRKARSIRLTGPSEVDKLRGRVKELEDELIARGGKPWA